MKVLRVFNDDREVIYFYQNIVKIVHEKGETKIYLTLGVYDVWTDLDKSCFNYIKKEFP